MNKETLYALMLSALLMAMPGCAALVAGGAAAGATYLYVDGQLQREYQTSLDEAYEASRDTLQDMDLPIEKAEKDLSSASLRAKDGDRKVWISIDKKSDKKVNISVRVGVMGEEQAAKDIHEEINSRL